MKKSLIDRLSKKFEDCNFVLYGGIFHRKSSVELDHNNLIFINPKSPYKEILDLNKIILIGDNVFADSDGYLLLFLKIL